MAPELYKRIFDNNKNWVREKTELDPQYFHRLAQGQKPPILWIGCSDSRVPANEITGTEPGEIFVHRNIANMVIHTDMSMLSVLDYAVNVLEVRHVIVCGHYGCGGIATVLENRPVGIIDNWLRHIKDVYRLHRREIDAISDPELKARRLVELNIEEQVYNLAKTSIIQNAWARDRFIQIHGLIYDVSNGLLKDLKVTINDDQHLDKVYQLNLDNILGNEAYSGSV